MWSILLVVVLFALAYGYYQAGITKRFRKDLKTLQDRTSQLHQAVVKLTDRVDNPERPGSPRPLV